MASEKSSTRISARGIQTREQILQAARKLFATQGYHNTSVYDLFEKSGITKGALFHHWKSKEELALAVLEEMQENFEKNFFSIQAENTRAREKIERLLRLLSELSRDPSWSYGRIFAIWCTELPNNEPGIGTRVHALKARWCVLWKDLIRKAQQEHDLRGDISSENLSFLVVSAISGVQLMCGASETESTGKVAYETLRKALLT
ncbi:MAG TPA: TetR/AcrR family transcriptional regulator [Planctomycetota bacterium]|nr:TetR/AcrR family transcriptional regulator [Planctomycetota bacterium]